MYTWENLAYNRILIKCIAIGIVKCDLFFHYCDAKEISFNYFCDAKLCAKYKKTCEFHLYCLDHVCKVNEWHLVYCFYGKFRVSTQIMVHDYCITKSKMFFACTRLLMPLWAVFFFFFAIQNIYVNLNPVQTKKRPWDL